MARDAKTFSSADHAVPCGKHTNRYAINESRACCGAIESFSEKIRRGYTGVTRARALPLKYWKIITPRIVRCVIQIGHNLRFCECHVGCPSWVIHVIAAILALSGSPQERTFGQSQRL